MPIFSPALRAENWGQGFTSSSDARMYGVPAHALNATYHPHYFASRALDSGGHAATNA
jgi:hypothetical protein